MISTGNAVQSHAWDISYSDGKDETRFPLSQIPTKQRTDRNWCSVFNRQGLYRSSALVVRGNCIGKETDMPKLLGFSAGIKRFVWFGGALTAPEAMVIQDQLQALRYTERAWI